MKLKYIDLFSGIGGFRYSLMESCKKNNISCECVGFSEIDKNAIKTYSANFNHDRNEKSFGDISSITSFNLNKKRLTASDYAKYDKKIDESVPDFDVLFAGFPCQPFSLMGNSEGFADSRGTLFFHIERIISAKRPKFFLLENVRGMVIHDKGKTFDMIINILEKKLNYSVIAWVLNSSDYGVPQTRRRVYILGVESNEIKQKLLEPPKKVDLRRTSNPTTWHLLDRDVDKKYYLSKKILKTILSDGSGRYVSKSEIDPLVAKPLCATMHKMHRASQDNYFSERFIRGHYNKKNNVVIKNKNAPKKVRRITPTEAFRLHGFPDTFVENAKRAGVSDTQLYRQAGNSVTVGVVERILSRVIPEITAV